MTSQEQIMEIVESATWAELAQETIDAEYQKIAEKTDAEVLENARLPKRKELQIREDAKNQKGVMKT